MKRMSNGTVMMQLSPENRGAYTMRTNLNPAYCRAVRENLKEYGEKIAQAIQAGNAQQAVALTVQAGKVKRCSLEHINNANKIVYDRAGNAVYSWDTKEQALYILE